MDHQPVAALYVETGGAYFDLPGVDPWDEPRDARRYDGPHPVVAHPPCQRWGRFWGGNPKQQPRLKLGDDKGCFAAALAAVRAFGGVIEHPEASHAWEAHGLNKPPKTGGWIQADFQGAGPVVLSKGITATCPAKQLGSMRTAWICQVSSGERPMAAYG